MKPSFLWLASLLIPFLAACTTAVEQAFEESKPTPSPAVAVIEEQNIEETNSPTPMPINDIKAIGKINLATVPDVDTSQHSVPMEEIIFDTFQPVNRAVPLTEIQPAVIRALRDAIPPLYEPQFSDIPETDVWLADSDIVLGYADGDEVYAYPVKILNFHKMVSHQVNGRDILASYCPLCGSGIVYDRLLSGSGAPLLLGNTSALFEIGYITLEFEINDSHAMKVYQPA